jgi:pyruvate/2-oxoglutarate dehydrogenase complex dihydrolipoamide dehydrogenase (E3) component
MFLTLSGENEGIQICTGASCICIENQDGKIALNADCDEGAEKIIGSHIVPAVGRKPNTDELGLNKAGVETDERGYVTVDDALETNISGIWAIGDVNGRGAFTHISYNDYEILVANMLDNDRRKVSDRITNYGLFIDPPLGRVGMTETQAGKSGKKVLIGEMMMARIGRARECSETQRL